MNLKISLSGWRYWLPRLAARRLSYIRCAVGSPSLM
jgi:hypothetical protein